MTNPLDFRMKGTIEFDRNIDLDTDNICLGGYDMQFDDTVIQFDFEFYSANVDPENPRLLHFETRNPDYDTFPSLGTLTEDMLRNVTAIPVFLVATEVSEGVTSEVEKPLVPVELVALEFVLLDKDYEVINVKGEVLSSALGE